VVNPIEVNRENWDERAAIHARDTTGDYMLDRFRRGEDALYAIEAAELSDMPSRSGELPSRPGELHPGPLTEPCLTVSRHTARATH